MRRITVRQSILSVLQMPEFGRQIIYGVVIVLLALIYDREKLQSCVVPPIWCPRPDLNRHDLSVWGF